MEKELISVIDAASQLGKYKSTIFKIIKKLKITPTKQGHSQHRGQMASYISMEEFNRIAEYFSINQNSLGETDMESPNEANLTDTGVFYLIQLEPTLAPGRFKVGFASIMNERLRKHRCSAPFATIIATWPCRKLWEQTAIDCVTADVNKYILKFLRQVQ